MSSMTGCKSFNAQILLALAMVFASFFVFASPCASSKTGAGKTRSAFATKVHSKNLIALGQWSLGEDCVGSTLSFNNGAMQVHSECANGLPKKLLISHALNLEDCKKAGALHVHLQAKSNTPQQLGIEILGPDYPYPHALNEVRSLKSDWQTFDFDCVTQTDIGRGIDCLSMILKLKGSTGTVLFKDVRVLPTSLAAIGVNSIDLSDEGVKNNIKKNRKGRIVVEVLNSRGEVVPGANVQIFQTSKKFLFGTEVQGLKPADTSSQQLLFQKQLSGVCNFATVTPYWPQVERVQGKVDYKPFDDQISWLAQHKFVIKLTPAFWPHWPPEFLSRNWESAKVEATKNLQDFCIHFGAFPVTFLENNEVAAALTDSTQNGLINWVNAEGAAKVLEQVTEIERHTLDSSKHQRLIYNDYEEGQTEFDMLDQLQREGQLPDSIGIEMHMTQGEWPLERIAYIIHRLARYERPLYVTEISVVSGEHRWVKPGTNAKDWASTFEGEKRQAEYVAKLYSFLFSNKNIEGITWWDFTDKDSWEGAPRGLLRKDMTAKPALLLLQNLISEQWQSNVNSQTDEHGFCTANVFEGEYNISVGDLNSSSKPKYSQKVTVHSSASPTKISFRYKD